MPNITRSALDALSLTNFPNNTSQLISPADLRDWLENGIDSFVTQKDSSRLENVIYENEGSDIAASATVNLASATGNFLHITGAATISSFGTCPAGARFVLVFDGICTLTYNATSLIIPGSSNKTTAANDCCMIVSEGSGNWRIVGYFPISGGGGGGGTVTAVTATAPLASTGGTAPDISIPQANGSTDGYLSSGDWTTFNSKGNGTVQSVSGTGTVNGISLSGTVTGTGNLTLGGSLSGVSLTTQVSGTLPFGNGGTGQTSYTDGQLLIGNTSTGGLTKATLTQGSGVTITNGNGTITIAATGGGPATISIGSTITSGTNGSVLFVGSGQLQQDNTNFFFDNANDRLSIAGTTTPGARLQLGAGSGTVPHLILTPTSAATISGTTNGSLWVDTASSNTSITMRKDSNYTKIVTIDRNPDLATSGTALLQADSNGSISRGGELTALGIYAQTNTPTAITTGSGSLIGTVTGVTALPANFFGTGKTIAFYLSGLISMANSGGPLVAIDFRITDGTTTVTLGTLSYDTTNLTNRVYVIDTSITCRSSGSNPVFGVAGKMIVNHTAKDQETVFITPAAVTATSLNTSSALTLQVVATWTNPGTTSSISSIVNYCHYLN
jgi:hypothetical protein